LPGIILLAVFEKKNPYYRKRRRPIFEMVIFYSLAKIGEYFDLNT
jgi:hypothetical protein